MRSYWGKHENEPVAGRGDGTGATASQSRVDRRFTVGLTRAEQLAVMLAKSRAAKVVEVADLLAGMYIYEWDRLARFWRENEEIEEFLRRICSISPQRWNHWIEFYDKQRQESVATGFLRRARSAVRRSVHDAFFEPGATKTRRRSHGSAGSKHDSLTSNSSLDARDDGSSRRSAELEQILQAAGEISPFRDEADGREVPVLTSECVLLCIAKNFESDVSRKLRETGLDLFELERVARDPRRAPHH